MAVYQFPTMALWDKRMGGEILHILRYRGWGQEHQHPEHQLLYLIIFLLLCSTLTRGLQSENLPWVQSIISCRKWHTCLWIHRHSWFLCVQMYLEMNATEHEMENADLKNRLIGRGVWMNWWLISWITWQIGLIDRLLNRWINWWRYPTHFAILNCQFPIHHSLSPPLFISTHCHLGDQFKHSYVSSKSIVSINHSLTFWGQNGWKACLCLFQNI